MGGIVSPEKELCTEMYPQYLHQVAPIAHGLRNPPKKATDIESTSVDSLSNVCDVRQNGYVCHTSI